MLMLTNLEFYKIEKFSIPEEPNSNRVQCFGENNKSKESDGKTSSRCKVFPGDLSEHHLFIVFPSGLVSMSKLQLSRLLQRIFGQTMDSISPRTLLLLSTVWI